MFNIRKFRKEDKGKNTVSIVFHDTMKASLNYYNGQLNENYKFSFKWFDSIKEAEDNFVSKIEEILKDGYIEDESILFIKNRESKSFDKAKWHYGGEFPIGLPQYQGYVVTGFYVGYLMQNGLMSAKYYRHKNYLQHTEAVKTGSLSPVKFFHDYMDGVFLSDDTNNIGYLFSKNYYEPDHYFNDLASIEAFEPLESLYHIEDNSTNYQLVYAAIDQAFKAFLKEQQIVFP